MPANTPSITQLKRAIEISERIQQLQRELDSILGSSAQVSSSPSPAPAATGKRGPGRPRRKGNLSPEARERIAAAQRARWAKVKGTAVAAAPAESKKPGRKKRRGGKRVISAEARVKMAEAARRRWAAVKKK